jgi:glycosyltransferase involved in cell wall biosynthesis
VNAVREVAERARPDVALANHLVMGPAILARAVGGRVPYAVKVHGSALEYTVRPHPARFLPFAREGLEPAEAVLVGSRHTAESLWEVARVEGLQARTRLGPPGVDAAFRPRPPADAAAGVTELADRLERGGAAGWGGEREGAAELRALDPAREPIVGYVGKLIVSKGVDLLLAAWPLVGARVPAARLCVVGFGTYRMGLAQLVDALARGDLAPAREVAERGRELEGGPRKRLAHLAAFLDRLGAGRLCPPFSSREYAESAERALARVHFTGRLEHSDLPSLLPSFSAQVVPSTFPEAFGMVAAEAASCGVPPVSAAHSGLAEVSAALAPALAERRRASLSFQLDEGAVESIAERLLEWLTLDPGERTRASEALAEAARRLYGWERVAEGMLAAARGRLDALPEIV